MAMGHNAWCPSVPPTRDTAVLGHFFRHLQADGHAAGSRQLTAAQQGSGQEAERVFQQ